MIGRLNNIYQESANLPSKDEQIPMQKRERERERDIATNV